MSTEISTQRAATGLALQSFDDAFRFAKMVANSEFSPKDFKGKPESCMLAIQHGSEVGLSPMQSLQSIAVINGRPTIWGDAALALVQASPVCEYVREYTEGDGDNLTAVCEVKRRGYPQPHISRFSVADAKKASLWGKSGPWSQYPGRMLALRARGFALRNAFADALRGLITAEEAQDYPQSDQQTPFLRGGYAAKVTSEGEVVADRVVVRPKFDAPPGGVIKLKTQGETPEPSPVEKARLAIASATSLDQCDRLKRLITERLKDGVFTPAEHDELAGLLVGRAEILIPAEVTT